MSAEEKEEYREGASILFDLGWPSNHFNYPMIIRAIAGLVPKYEGLHTFLEYQVRWAREDLEAKMRRKQELSKP
jgi:hypothetical protein